MKQIKLFMITKKPNQMGLKVLYNALFSNLKTFKKISNNINCVISTPFSLFLNMVGCLLLVRQVIHIIVTSYGKRKVNRAGNKEYCPDGWYPIHGLLLLGLRTESLQMQMQCNANGP